MLHSAPMPSAAILSERRRRGPGDCFAARNEMHSLYMRSFVWPRDRRVYCDLAAGDEGVGGWMRHSPSHAARAHTRGFLRHENANFLTDTHSDAANKCPCN